LNKRRWVCLAALLARQPSRWMGLGSTTLAHIWSHSAGASGLTGHDATIAPQATSAALLVVRISACRGARSSADRTRASRQCGNRKSRPAGTVPAGRDCFHLLSGEPHSRQLGVPRGRWRSPWTGNPGVRRG